MFGNLGLKVKLALAANKLVDQIGKLGLPHGPIATYVGSFVMILIASLNENQNLFPDNAKPWIAIAIAILTLVHTLSALAVAPPGGWNVSAGFVIITQAIGATIQTMNQLVPMVGPEAQTQITMWIQILMSMQTLTALFKNPK